MSFGENLTINSNLDLQQFLEAETQKRRFKLLVTDLTDRCWDLCMKNVSSSLDAKTEHCFVNCADRFIDTSNLIVSRFESTQSSASNPDSMISE